ncbi:MAG: TlpA family protein disulfide reductase [Myxococcaceae bacterium]|nr:TlpA family protein disulfide reductase [Myxococcaceae bacterium]
MNSEQDPLRPPPDGMASKVIIALAVILGGAAVIALAVMEARSQHVAVNGAISRNFVLDKFGGGTISLAEARAKGKVVMVDFWATWCGPCVEELPSLVKLAKEYESKGVVFVAANHDGDPDAKVAVALFLEKMPDLARYTGFADDEMARAFDVQALPSLYFLGQDGTVLEAHRGALSERQLRSRIEDVLSRAP